MNVFLGALCLAALAGGESAAIGQPVPDFELKAVFGGDGRTRLSEFRGQPVLIADWSDFQYGLGAAKGAVKLDAELGKKGLVVILHESKDHKREWIEGLALRNFPGTGALLMRTQSFPIEYEDNGFPPKLALIGVDGTLKVAGSYLADMGDAGKLAKSELKRAKSGWGGSSAAKKARAAAYGKHDLAGARALIEAALEENPDDADLLAVKKEIETRFKTRHRAVGYLMEQGEYARAWNEAELLQKSVEDDAEWAPMASELIAGFEAEDAQRELALEKKLDSLTKSLRKKGPKGGEEEKLRAFAQEASGTKVGARAERVAAAVVEATAGE